MTNKPMLFLDVDGVLSPFIKKTPPRDWRNSWRKYEFPDLHGKPFRDWLNPVQAEALYAFADRVDITWATTWNNYPEQLAVLCDHLGFPSDLSTIGPTYGGNKFDAIKNYIANNGYHHRPFIWIEDEIDPSWASWAKDYPSHTLILHTIPQTGLKKIHLDLISMFLSDLTSVSEYTIHDYYHHIAVAHPAHKRK